MIAQQYKAVELAISAVEARKAKRAQEADALESESESVRYINPRHFVLSLSPYPLFPFPPSLSLHIFEILVQLPFCNLPKSYFFHAFLRFLRDTSSSFQKSYFGNSPFFLWEWGGGTGKKADARSMHYAQLAAHGRNNNKVEQTNN